MESRRYSNNLCINMINVTNIDKWKRFDMFNQIRTDKYIEECGNIYDNSTGEYSNNKHHTIYKYTNNKKMIYMEGIKIVYIYE